MNLDPNLTCDELRESVLSWLVTQMSPYGADDLVDSLIAAAHAEGATEGTEKEKERIRQHSQRYQGGEYAECFGQEWYLVLASDLNPEEKT
jgi:hypothetical protein